MFKITVEQIIKLPVKVLYDEYFLFIAASDKPKFIKNVMYVLHFFLVYEIPYTYKI